MVLGSVHTSLRVLRGAKNQLAFGELSVKLFLPTTMLVSVFSYHLPLGPFVAVAPVSCFFCIKGELK